MAANHSTDDLDNYYANLPIAKRVDCALEMLKEIMGKEDGCFVLAGHIADRLRPPSDDADSHDLADRLLNNSDFHEMIDTKFGCSAITKGIYENSELQELKYISLTSSVQGEIKKVGNKQTCIGPLLAIFVGDYESSRQISIHCCIQNDIMKCFSPDAKSLNPIIKNGPAKKANLYC